MLSRSEIKKAVRSGANLLRKHDPKWFEKIDISTLDLQSRDNCILAQVFGGWEGFKWAIATLFTHDVVPHSPISLNSSQRWASYWSWCMCDNGFEPDERDDLPGFVEEWGNFVSYLKREKHA